MSEDEVTGQSIRHNGYEIREVLDTRQPGTPRTVGWDVYRDGQRVYVGYSSSRMAKQMIDAGAFDRAF
mgnify:CR=1 FL=1